jgi:hypothetical protein
MRPFIFCKRCGWVDKRRQGRYVVHRLRCGNNYPKRSTLVIFALLLVVLEAGLLSSNAIGFFEETMHRPLNPAIDEAGIAPVAAAPVAVLDPGIRVIDALLKKFEVNRARRERLAGAIVRSSRRYNVDPRLVASIMIVESRGNPFAISGSDAVGIMQIHVPTWSRVIDEEGINLFNIEDNIDFGVRILSHYVVRHGQEEGIKRYNGWHPGSPESIENAERYLQKVQHVYVAD